MFETLVKKVGSLFVNQQDRQRDAFLGASVDFIDLENRMRIVEMNPQPFAFYSTVAAQHALIERYGCYAQTPLLRRMPKPLPQSS